MTIIVGSDLDGTLSWNRENVAKYRPFRKYEWYKKCLPTKYSKYAIDFIITGRKEHFRKVTLDWLKSNGVQYKELVMYPNKIKRTNRSLAIYKAYKINKLCVTLYLEDDKRIAEFLMDYCPNTEVVLINVDDEIEFL